MTVAAPTLERRGPARYRIAPAGDMRVPGIVLATESLLPDDDGQTLAQVANVATLPGIVEASFAMPDLHLGYGFPIGGVAATDVADGGVVSPGGVGFDISCGVRILAASVRADELSRATLGAFMDQLAERVPAGAGPGGAWSLRSADELRRVLADGARFAVDAGYGVDADLERIEDRGRVEGADADAVSDRALRRGLRQMGSLGGGNHFLEVQAVERILDPVAAAAFGVSAGQLTVTIHTGSRGLGHQICTDHVRALQPAIARHAIRVPDRQLACAPVRSPEGEAYLAAMAAAANYARANRQVIAEAARDALAKAVGEHELRVVYDVSHNMAKLERHDVGGAPRLLCVHRKGATLALPPGDPGLPADLATVGQPVLVPGSMATASWLLAGAGGEAFSSTCHGAGRARSRGAAKRAVDAAELRRRMHAGGIAVRAASDAGLAEEAPEAYKDVDEVVRACELAGLSRRVARLRPLGVVKG